jgi:hypothetical protein
VYLFTVVAEHVVVVGLAVHDSSRERGCRSRRDYRTVIGVYRSALLSRPRPFITQMGSITSRPEMDGLSAQTLDLIGLKGNGYLSEHVRTAMLSCPR